jgi:hypothetical protein
MRPSQPARHFWPLRNQRFFCSLKSRHLWALTGWIAAQVRYAVHEANEHRAIALFKLRPDHTADERIEVVAELTQSSVDSLVLRPGMIKPL